MVLLGFPIRHPVIAMPRNRRFHSTSRSCSCGSGAPGQPPASRWEGSQLELLSGMWGELSLHGAASPSLLVRCNWGGHGQHYRIGHRHELSSVFNTKVTLDQDEIVPHRTPGSEVGSASSTWTWVSHKSCFFNPSKHIPHRWANCGKSRWVGGKWLEANSAGFMSKSSEWTVNILMLVCPHVIWDHEEARGDFPMTTDPSERLKPAAVHHIDHS